jgi:hypothetical protein
MALVAERTTAHGLDLIDAEIVGAKIVDPKILDGEIIDGRIVGGRLIDRQPVETKSNNSRRAATERFHSEITAVVGFGLVLLVIFLLRF